MDPVSLQCFLAAARLGTFRRASEQVGLSPPAFSDRIQRLEEEVGEKLFTRTSRAVHLLPAGERLRPLAEEALAALARCRAAVSDAPLPYTITLGTRFELGMSWLVPALDALAAAHPERTLHLVFGMGQELLSRLHSGALDAAVLSTRLTDPRLEYATLHREDYTFVGAPDLAGEGTVRGAADVQQHALVDTIPSLPLFGYVRDATQPEEIWRFASVQLMGTIAAVRQRALEGHGLAVLPTYFVQADLDAGLLVNVAPTVPILSDAFRLVWRGTTGVSDRMETLAAELRAMPLQ